MRCTSMCSSYVFSVDESGFVFNLFVNFQQNWASCSCKIVHITKYTPILCWYNYNLRLFLDVCKVWCPIPLIWSLSGLKTLKKGVIVGARPKPINIIIKLWILVKVPILNNWTKILGKFKAWNLLKSVIVWKSAVVPVGNAENAMHGVAFAIAAHIRTAAPAWTIWFEALCASTFI